MNKEQFSTGMLTLVALVGMVLIANTAMSQDSVYIGGTYYRTGTTVSNQVYKSYQSPMDRRVSALDAHIARYKEKEAKRLAKIERKVQKELRKAEQ